MRIMNYFKWLFSSDITVIEEKKDIVVVMTDSEYDEYVQWSECGRIVFDPKDCNKK